MSILHRNHQNKNQSPQSFGKWHGRSVILENITTNS